MILDLTASIAIVFTNSSDLTAEQFEAEKIPLREA